MMIHRLRHALRHRWLLSFTAVALVFVVGAATAFAYFRALGAGSGVSTTGSAQAVTVQAVTSGAPSSTLIPGGSADLLVQVNNPNNISVTVVGVSQNGATVTPVGGSGCTNANSGVSVPPQSGLTITVAPGTQLVHITNGVSMSTSSASGCQGAIFQIPVMLTVRIG